MGAMFRQLRRFNGGYRVSGIGSAPDTRHPTPDTRALARSVGPQRSARRGFTLVELGVAVIIIGILVTLVVPSFVRVSEQNRVDAASQYLRSIWSAERIYWLEHKTFTSDLADLSSMGLIDTKIAAGNDGFFDYAISAANSTTFGVNAVRNGSGVWTGTLRINQDGDVTGFVGGNNSVVLLPPDI